MSSPEFPFRIFEVGGCVRDAMLGVPTKDVDFAVEAESFDAMRAWIQDQGFHIWQERPEFLTIRASVAKTHPLRERTKDADFVLCRSDSEGSDGRRPDSVQPASILADLERRDFTINAMAIDCETGVLLDPHGGQEDLARKVLRFVGDPQVRIQEDALRILRALRFAHTKGFTLAGETARAVFSDEAIAMLATLPLERFVGEVEKVLQHDLRSGMEWVLGLPDGFQEILWAGDRVFLNHGLSMRPAAK